MKDRDLQFYNKNEIKRMMRYQCAWCDQRLDQSNCGAIYGPCTEGIRALKRYECMKGYKPRIDKAPSKASEDRALGG